MDNQNIPQKYNAFDPFIFLELTDLPEAEKKILGPQLLDKISQFIILKTTVAHQERVMQMTTLEEIFSLIDPQKLAGYLQEFKTSFQKAYYG